MTTDDNFDPAAFKAFCATLGIATTTVVDAFGRTDVLLDRAGIEQFRAAALAAGLTDVGVVFTRCLMEGDAR